MNSPQWTTKLIEGLGALSDALWSLRPWELLLSLRPIDFLDRILVIELILITIGTTAVFYFRNIRKAQRGQVSSSRWQLLEFFCRCWDNNKLERPIDLPNDWRALEYLIPVMDQLNERYAHDNIKWPQMSDAIYEGILLPIARKEISSSSWLHRHWALRCFGQAPRHRDLGHIMLALYDAIPHNRFAVVGTLMALADKQVIHQIIQTMASESRHSRGLYNIAFKHLSPKLLDHVREYLYTVRDASVRRVCWDILEKYPEHSEYNEALKDLFRSNISLRMSALRFLAHFDNEEISQLILSLIDDAEWEIRALAVKIIGDRGDQQGLFKLRARLRDTKWWVRMNSALAIQKLGEPGRKVLEQVKAEDDRFAYETVQYVLTLSQLNKETKVVAQPPALVQVEPDSNVIELTKQRSQKQKKSA